MCKYCDKKDYYYCKKDYCHCDCTKTKEAVYEALLLSNKARFGIETVFEYEFPCENIDVVLEIQKNTEKYLEDLICILKELSKYYDKDCFECGYESAYIVQRALKNAEIAYEHWYRFGELICDCKCECILCEALILVAISFERIARSEILVATLKKLLKYKEDPCRKEC